MRTARAALVALVVAAGGVAAVPVAQAADTPAPVPVQVTVNSRAGLATTGDAAVGVNHAVWDTDLGTDTVADLLHDAGTQIMRYPGGSYSDIYHWKDNTAPGGYVAPDTDFDHFMAGVHRAGAQAMVIANYGTGTPQEAADWVRYANVEKQDGVRYWEIGNELYGNGHYGASWESDDHPAKTPAEYATNLVQFSRAMKAVDPTIKIGAVLTTPGNWPDGLVGDGDAGTWNQVVLSIAAPDIDFAILHWYPGGSSAPVALGKVAQVRDITAMTRQLLDRYSPDRRLGIAVTEMNAGYGENTQPGALFAADAYAALLENGVFTVDWWDVHNGPGTASTVAGQTDFNDFGLLSSGTCTSDGSACEPPRNTPFAPYYGISLVSRLARPGAEFLRTGSSDPLVVAHAARQPDGDLAVLLANEDPDAARAVTMSYQGYQPAASAQVLSYGNGDSRITTSSGSAATRMLPPYSLTVLLLHPSSTPAGPAAVGRPTASAVTVHDATLSWPAAGSGVKYEVFRQNGAVSEQWGETPGTSFTVHNLEPGTTYTANVVTRDSAGRVSWASPPVTFTTGTPDPAACAVRLSDTNDWGNGYVGSIDITNTSSETLRTWTLRFAWPTAWQQLSSGWNATWSESGGTVAVRGADSGAAIAPGATVNVGFVGAYQGPNVLPALYTLNGKTCTTR
ncbi:cellulose binding domain-containing protein [Cellulomonas alba]|uniref:Cellulose binding domain-containing protein n=1 Tax=Cellulomonas alba TaxID=3053467 RepID=A0ABT7SEW4_9CELL|nr:cellulose binding domain-containing protein [Cellulomonas alba]MDM7854715.1 cellulose binding domain-containing protein [Cellulomonas alba]